MANYSLSPCENVTFVSANLCLLYMNVAGPDRDDGNWLKCVKHGVSRVEIEQVLMGEPAVMADPHAGEPQIRAIGRTEAG